MPPRIDPVQKLKDQIVKLSEEQQVKLYAWLEAVRDVRVEDARRAATKSKEETKS